MTGRPRLTTEEFIRRAVEIHGDRYIYSSTIFSGLLHKVNVTCRDHGEFHQLANDHLTGSGCRECWILSQRFTRDEFIERATIVHGNKYDYSSMIFDGVNSKMNVICRIHGDFTIRGNAHLDGQGCPKCTSRISFVESQWLDSLNNKNLVRQYQLPENRHRTVDGYDPSTHTVYQFHGDYWHGNLNRFDSNKVNHSSGKTMQELYDRTLIMDQQIRDWGYNLIVMWESDWNSIRSKIY